MEKPLKQEQKKEDKKKDNCVATIVGVLSLPDNFCAGATEKVEKKEKNVIFQHLVYLFHILR